MSDLTKRFEKIMKEIEERISNKDDLEFINKKIAEISLIHVSVIEQMTEILTSKLAKIEENQNELNSRVEGIEDSINYIESDMYDDEFEIICPYCNNQFWIDIESNSEVICPECNNVIELELDDNNK